LDAPLDWTLDGQRCCGAEILRRKDPKRWIEYLRPIVTAKGQALGMGEREIERRLEHSSRLGVFGISRDLYLP
jgi:hypothetical protein